MLEVLIIGRRGSHTGQDVVVPLLGVLFKTAQAWPPGHRCRSSARILCGGRQCITARMLPLHPCAGDHGIIARDAAAYTSAPSIERAQPTNDRNRKLHQVNSGAKGMRCSGHRSSDSQSFCVGKPTRRSISVGRHCTSLEKNPAGTGSPLKAHRTAPCRGEEVLRVEDAKY